MLTFVTSKNRFLRKLIYYLSSFRFIQLLSEKFFSKIAKKILEGSFKMRRARTHIYIICYKIMKEGIVNLSTIFQKEIKV